MKTRRIFLLAAILIFLIPESKAQVVTSDPAFPTDADALIVYFDATQGTGGLENYTGDVYAHTGVLLTSSSNGTDWKYVKTNWGVNSEDTKLTRISTNLYSLDIGPSIRDYYGVGETDVITHMAFVFRSSDSSKEGKDDGGENIFIEVYEAGLNISITTPNKNSILDLGGEIDFNAVVSESADLELFLDDASIKTATADNMSHTFTFNTGGDYWIRLTAETAEETDRDSIFVHVVEDQVNEALPEGLVDGINYIDETTVQLVLYAPGKESVFAIGDFNKWVPGSAARMKKDIDRFWITLSGLVPGQEYAFQYLVDRNKKIADPYTDKVLDPSNDKWISNSTYPDLKKYPYEYTSGITSVFQTAQIAYEWQYQDFVPHEEGQLVIYELLVRDFIAAHDWKTLIDTLDYLSRLGINAIELMPFNEFEGNESWGYNPSFYFAPDKYYGPKDDLKAFIDSCHSRDIAVIMDMVFNHSYSQSPLVQLYYNEATFKVTSENPWYNVDSPNTSYSWGYDFDHESQATKDFMDRANAYWLTEYKLDGFRFDFTKGFTNTPGDGSAYDAARITILERMADAIWAANPDAYVILEHFAPNAEEEELSNHGMMIWGNINHNYNEASMGYNESGKSDFSWISYEKRGWSDPHLVGYMESHDEERLMFKNLEYGNASGSYNIKSLNTALDRMKLAGAFFFTIPGPKMIWQFGELGYDYSIEHNGRVGNKPIRWDYYDNAQRYELFQVYAALIKLKTSEPAFSTNDFALSTAYAGKRIELNHADMDIRIIGNFDVQSLSVDPNFSQTGTWYDYFSGDSIEVSNTNELISLSPGEFRIYTSGRLEKPDIIIDVDEQAVVESGMSVYPVPAVDDLFISTYADAQNLTIYDLNGRMVSQLNATGTMQNIDVSGLKSGIYFLQIEFDGHRSEFAKFIKK